MSRLPPWSPALAEREPLSEMVAEFAASIRDGRSPRTDGGAGLRVLSILEASRESLRSGGRFSPVVSLTTDLEDASWES